MTKRSKLTKTRGRLQATEKRLKALTAAHEQTSRRLQWAERQADNLRNLLGPGTRHGVFFDVSAWEDYDHRLCRADLRAVFVRYVDGVLQGPDPQTVVVACSTDPALVRMERTTARKGFFESRLRNMVCELSSEVLAELFRRHALTAESLLANVRESPVGPSPVGL
jgi:hypothetical protein